MVYSARQAPTSGLGAYVRAYVEQLHARGYCQQTQAYRQVTLLAFLDWTAERGIVRLTEITRPVLQRYQRHLAYAVARGGKPLSPAGQMSRLVAIRGFFRYLTRENLLLYNPATELDLPKQEKRLPRDVLTAHEAELVLAQPDISTAIGVRDRAILEVLYSTGIRRAELLNLQRRDLSAARGVLAVRQGKGKKDRFVPIGDRALAWLQKYLDEVRPQLETTDIYTLFIDLAGRKLEPQHLSRAVQRYLQASGVDKQGRCHIFRHTAATLMLENGADVRYIQQMLGHAKLTTTEIYTHVSIAKLKEIHRATHPARLKPGLPGLAPQPAEPEDLLAALDAEGREEEQDAA